jgi:hypothetical protein
METLKKGDIAVFVETGMVFKISFILPKYNNSFEMVAVFKHRDNATPDAIRIDKVCLASDTEVKFFNSFKKQQPVFL